MGNVNKEEDPAGGSNTKRTIRETPRGVRGRCERIKIDSYHPAHNAVQAIQLEAHCRLKGGHSVAAKINSTFLGPLSPPAQTDSHDIFPYPSTDRLPAFRIVVNRFIVRIR